jgi:hypothetical protein
MTHGNTILAPALGGRRRLREFLRNRASGWKRYMRRIEVLSTFSAARRQRA